MLVSFPDYFCDSSCQGQTSYFCLDRCTIKIVISVRFDSLCGSLDFTCRLGFHVSGEFAAHAVVISADVVKAPACELLGAVELWGEQSFGDTTCAASYGNYRQ